MFGLLLVAVGIFFLLEQVVEVRLSSSAWPFYIIAPGVILLIAAVSIDGPFGDPLAILGGIVTGTGVLLAVQDSTDTYESWAYAWALIIPASAGVGQLIYGLFKRRTDRIRSGLALTVAGVVLFVICKIGLQAAENFDFVQISARVWPLFIIGVGIVLLVGSFFGRRRHTP
jgi:peptidoglycan/LPS O-acetylase OafA/YrhL